MTSHTVGTRDDWVAAREQLLVREKEHTRLGDKLARQRREELLFQPRPADVGLDQQQVTGRDRGVCRRVTGGRLRQERGRHAATGSGFRASRRQANPREAVSCVPSMFDSLGVQVPYTT